MARKKKKKKSKGWFGFGSSSTSRKTKRRYGQKRTATFAVLKSVAYVLLIVVAGGAVAIGMKFLEGYVHNTSPVDTQPKGLELVRPPLWVGHQLDGKITDAAGDFYLDNANIAETVAARLQNFAWLYNVKVQTTSKTVQISASYRKPIAFVDSGKAKYYLSPVEPDDLRYEKNRKKVVVLDYMELKGLPIVEIKGFTGKQIPRVGSVWEAEEITVTADLLGAFGRMDEKSCKDKPLLNQIKAIDVFNFDGRVNKKESHNILYASDGTEILWGAAYGKSNLYLESGEQEKIGTLYTFYKENNYSLECRTNNVCQSVELRIPRQKYPRPRP